MTGRLSGLCGNPHGSGALKRGRSSFRHSVAGAGRIGVEPEVVGAHFVGAAAKFLLLAELVASHHHDSGFAERIEFFAGSGGVGFLDGNS